MSTSKNKPDLSHEKIATIISKLAEHGVTVDGSGKLEQDKSIQFYKDGHLYDHGRGGHYYHDIKHLLDKRPDLINAPVQPKAYRASSNYTKPDVDELTARHLKHHKELIEFSDFKEKTLMKELDEFLPSSWFVDGYPSCLGYRAEGVKTLVVSALDVDDKAQSVCYRRDRKLQITDNDDGVTESRRVVEIKWRTDGSKKFIPSKLTGKSEVYLASGMGELVMLELLGVDYICLQSDGMVNHLSKTSIQEEDIQHLIILPDNDDTFMSRLPAILNTLKLKKASVVEWEHSDPREAAKALGTREAFISTVAECLEKLELPKVVEPKSKVETADYGVPVKISKSDESIVLSIGRYPIHKVANHDPMASRIELDALKIDINANDQKEEIVLFRGKIVDGRNRCLVCLELGIVPRTRDLPHNTTLEELKILARSSATRRNLTMTQKAIKAYREKKITGETDEAICMQYAVGKKSLTDARYIEKNHPQIGAILFRGLKISIGMAVNEKTGESYSRQSASLQFVAKHLRWSDDLKKRESETTEETINDDEPIEVGRLNVMTSEDVLLDKVNSLEEKNVGAENRIVMMQDENKQLRKENKELKQRVQVVEKNLDFFMSNFVQYVKTRKKTQKFLQQLKT